MSDNQALIISSIDESQATLQSRFQEWGYLYLKNYVNPEKCGALLNAFISELAPHITFDEALSLPVLSGKAFVETDPIWDEVYPKMQSLEQFHAFFHDPHLLDLMKTVAGKEVFVYPMKMARISTPGKVGYETPPHQDARSHNAGPTMAGIWVALHKISPTMGRLKILPRSHKKGVRDVHTSAGVGGVQCEIFADETTWHVSDVEQGDVIIFHSSTIHAAEANVSAKLSRLSVDTRFCDYGAPVYSSNLQPHHGWRIEGLDWNSIYRGWRQHNLQYYWRDYPNLF